MLCLFSHVCECKLLCHLSVDLENGNTALTTGVKMRRKKEEDVHSGMMFVF